MDHIKSRQNNQTQGTSDWQPTIEFQLIYKCFINLGLSSASSSLSTKFLGLVDVDWVKFWYIT